MSIIIVITLVPYVRYKGLARNYSHKCHLYDNDNDNEITLFGHREKTVKC